jgi:hypothetical protein
LLACRSNHVDVTRPAPAQRGFARAAVEPVTATPRPAQDGPLLPPQLAAEPSAPPRPSEAPAQEADDKPRDFAAELANMLGNPVSCLAPRPADVSPSTLQIGVYTQVMPSGAVSRAQVSAAGLTPAELQCITKRAETLRFAQPIENAPFPVHANISLQLSAAAKAPPSQLAAAADSEPVAAKSDGREPTPFLEPSPEAAPLPAAPPVQAPPERSAFLEPSPEAPVVPPAPPVEAPSDNN